jgi:hypothetical protein
VALEELGAVSGSLCMLEGDQVRLAAAVNYPADVVDDWASVPLETDLPACTAIRTGRIVFLEGTAEERARQNPLYAGRPLAGSQAYAVVPLGTEIAFGALVFGFGEARHFTAEQAQFLTSLAAQCAAALGRAELYEERERARVAAEASRARLAFLAETPSSQSPGSPTCAPSICSRTRASGWSARRTRATDGCTRYGSSSRRTRSISTLPTASAPRCAPAPPCATAAARRSWRPRRRPTASGPNCDA